MTVAGPGAIFIPALNSTCHGTCSFPAEAGASVRLEIAADAEGTFTGWSGACAGTSGCEVVGGEDVTITAAFLPGS